MNNKDREIMRNSEDNIFEAGRLRRLAKKYAVKAVILAAAVLLFFYTASFDLFDNINRQAAIHVFVEGGGTEAIDPGGTKEYSFSNGRCVFDAFLFYPEGEDISDLYVKFTDVSAGKILFDGPVPDDRIITDESNDRTAVRISTGDVLGKGDYRISITNRGSGAVLINVQGESGEELNYSLVKNTDLGVWMTVLIMTLIVLYLVLVFAFSKKPDFGFGRFFLLTAIVVGIIYFVLLPPWSAPDSGSHYAAAYRFSNILSGYPEDKEWYGRQEDGEFFSELWGQSDNPSMQSYADLAYNFKVFAGDRTITDMPFHEERMEYYSFINYWPQILGLTLGRLFHLSAIACAYLARLFILAFYIWACLHAIQTTPVGKSLFVLTALLPMSVMMSSAFSYDPMVIITTLNFTACVFALYKEPDSKRLLIEMSLWCFMIGAVKGGGYLIILPVIFILAGRRSERKRSLVNIVSAAGSGLFSVLLFDKILQIGNELFQFGTAGNGKMEASFALQHPVHYLRMMIETYIIYGNNLILNMMGTEMGWLEAVIPPAVIMLLAAVMCVYALYERDELKLAVRDKYILLSAVFLVIIFTPVMLLSWTDEGSPWIGGLQGRYFLPVLIPALMVLTKFSLKIRYPSEPAAFTDRKYREGTFEAAGTSTGENIEQKAADEQLMLIRSKCMRWFACLSILAVCYMARMYLTR